MSDCVLYPAIDLLGGRCVRLAQGDFARVSVFGDDPVAMARHWREQGAEWLHVVDLDGAREGEPRHLETLRAMFEATGALIQYSGGLRTVASVEAALAAGAARMALGTAAVRDRPLLEACLEHWSERVAVSLDVRGGCLAVAGWLQSVAEEPSAFAAEMVALGVRTLIITSVDRDGTLAGADDDLLQVLRAGAPGVRLIGGGGVASLADVTRMAALGMDGVLLGRALYDGAVSLPQALAAVAAEEETC
jgi:phosphoribosylformimino-5-aminoimidazole carboxamide ribotide isomerase